MCVRSVLGGNVTKMCEGLGCMRSGWKSHCKCFYRWARFAKARQVAITFIRPYKIILFIFKCINNAIAPFTENRNSAHFNRGEYQI